MKAKPTPTKTVQAILDAFSDRDGLPYHADGVRIERIDLFTPEDPKGYKGNAVKITTSTLSDDPVLVIVDPPLYVPDPNGDTVVGDQKFRRDPLAAMAGVIRMVGGSR